VEQPIPKLQNVIAAAKPNLSDAESRELEELLADYGDIFVVNSDDYGRTAESKYHHIDTAQPIGQSPRRLPLAKQAEVGEMLEDMQRCGVIEESDNPWPFPVVLLQKKTENLRFCIDYRKLNDIIRKDRFPLPWIDGTLDTLAGTKWFSILDQKSGYWQVDLHPGNKEKSAFSMGQGLW
jgi:hypothetical protein